MKRILSALLALALLAGLTACTGGGDGPPDFGRQQARQAVLPSSQVSTSIPDPDPGNGGGGGGGSTMQGDGLTGFAARDFYIYKDGTRVLESETGGAYYFDFEEDMSEYGYSSSEVETSRGISIGSSSSELSGAYPDAACIVLTLEQSADFDDIFEFMNPNYMYDSLDVFLDENPGESVFVVMYMCIIVDGKEVKFSEYLAGGGGYSGNDEMGMLGFAVIGGRVFDIMIAYERI